MIKVLRRFQSDLNHRKIQQQLKETTQKIKQRRTAADLSKIQSFVKENAYKGRIGNLINKTARLDSKFDSFMDQVQNEDQIPKVIDYNKKSQRTIRDGVEESPSK
jgi:hypothetical protein